VGARDFTMARSLLCYMLDVTFDDLVDKVPGFIREVGLGLLRLMDRVAPRVGDALEPYAAVIGWGMFGVAGIVIVMCVAGLFTRR